MRRTTVLFLAAALALGSLASLVAAGDGDVVRDGEHEAIVAAVGDVLHGEDAATRESAREFLRQNPDAAVGALLRALEELAAARRPPVAVTTTAPRAQDSPAAPAASGERVLQIYDVRDLVAGSGSQDAVIERVRALLTEGESVARQGDGILVVKAAPRTLGDIEHALAALRRGATEIVRIEARVVAAPFDAPLGREVSATRPGDRIDLGDPAAALARWLAAGDARVVTAPALSCFSGQRASVQTGREISFVADFDVEVGQSSFFVDPVIDTIYAGLEIELVPTAQGDGGVRVGVHATVTDVDLETYSASLGSTAGAVDFQIPAVTRTEVRRTVDVVDGGTVALRLGDARDERRLLLLTVTRVALDDDE